MDVTASSTPSLPTFPIATAARLPALPFERHLACEHCGVHSLWGDDTP
jgi:hypothetical protein